MTCLLRSTPLPEGWKLPSWWDEIIQGLTQTTIESLSLEGYGDPAGPSRIPLGNMSRRSKGLRKLLDWLWTQSPDKVNGLVKQLLFEIVGNDELTKAATTA